MNPVAPLPVRAAAGPTRSLRREWSRAFVVMLALLLVASIGTFAGVRQLVGQFSGTARRLDRETTTVMALDAALVVHEAAAHQLLNGVTLDRAAFVREQNAISQRYSDAIKMFPGASERATLLFESRGAWLVSMRKAGLWGDQVATFAVLPNVDQNTQLQVTLGADADTARAFLARMQSPTFDAMRQGLARDAQLEQYLTIALAGLFGLALAVTVYYRRRMSNDLLRPVAHLHDGVVRLEGGDYNHRIEVKRRDELGELAHAFNTMADAVHDSHLALTLRATHDPLTGLPNSASLAERLKASFGVTGGRRAPRESLLFIDVDDFKVVNDSLGHQAGDALLIELAARLRDCVRPQDLVARLGGDEFCVVVVEDDDGSGVAVGVAERVLAALRVPFDIGGSALSIGVSIGIAHRRPDTADAGELLRQGDFAMYMAKGVGKGSFQLFDSQMYDDMVRRVALKADLGTAITSGQLRLEYQPVADLRTGEIVGVEALVRWQHPTLGLLPPGDFIPVAEETGDIDAIGCWVLDTATREVAGWRSTMDRCAAVWVSVNLSAFQLPSLRSRAAIKRILADPAVEAGKVVLEVTESALAADIDGAVASLTELKRYGPRIAIDDFGTGFSSLSALASLPVDILKIDRSFVSGPASSRSVPMLEGILGLAAKLGLDVIAEGIETPEQLELLRSLRCHLGQGFFLSRPTSPQGIEKILASRGLLAVPVATP